METNHIIWLSVLFVVSQVFGFFLNLCWYLEWMDSSERAHTNNENHLMLYRRTVLKDELYRRSIQSTEEAYTQGFDAGKKASSHPPCDQL